MPPHPDHISLHPPTLPPSLYYLLLPPSIYIPVSTYFPLTPYLTTSLHLPPPLFLLYHISLYHIPSNSFTSPWTPHRRSTRIPYISRVFDLLSSPSLLPSLSTPPTPSLSPHPRPRRPYTPPTPTLNRRILADCSSSSSTDPCTVWCALSVWWATLWPSPCCTATGLELMWALFC